MHSTRILGALGLAAALVFVVAGCEGDSAEREKSIREASAKAAEKARPAVEEATRDVKAAVEGAKEGWDKGGPKTLDLNSATEDDLTSLPGVGPHEAKRIIKGRPYKDARDLVTRKILSESAYSKLKDDVRAD